MKKIYTFILLMILSVGFGQMTTSTAGNSVTFTFTDGTGSDWSCGCPLNLYLFIEDTNYTSSTTTGTVEPAGAWPGTQMTDQGGGVYTVTINLESFFDVGDQIQDISYIYNGSGFGGGQNPATGGFSAVGQAGFSSTTIASLSTIEINSEKSKSKIAANKLFVKEDGDYNIQVFDINGKLVKSTSADLTEGNGFDLTMEQGLYIIQLEKDGNTENLKVHIK